MFQTVRIFTFSFLTINLGIREFFFVVLILQLTLFVASQQDNYNANTMVDGVPIAFGLWDTSGTLYFLFPC